MPWSGTMGQGQAAGERTLMAATARDRWDARYRAGGAERREPSPFLVTMAGLLPRAGAASCPPTALDVAGGAGRNAVFLARCGFAVTVADIAPAGLALAAAAAAAAGVR